MVVRGECVLCQSLWMSLGCGLCLSLAHVCTFLEMGILFEELASWPM